MPENSVKYQDEIKVIIQDSDAIFSEVKVDVLSNDYFIEIEKDGYPLFTLNMVTQEVIKHVIPK